MTPLQTAEAAVLETREKFRVFSVAMKAKLEAKQPLSDDERAQVHTLTAESELASANLDDVKSLYNVTEVTQQRGKYDVEPENREGFDTFRRRGVKAIKGYVATEKKSAELQAYEFGQYILASLYPANNPSAVTYCKSHGVKALNEANNLQGGVLVPEETSAAIINLREMYGVFRQYADVVPMTRDVMTIPRRTSGVTTYYIGEGATITDSTPTFDNVGLTTRKLAALALLSSEIDEDAIIDLGAYVANEIAYGFAYAEDLAGFTGDGTSAFGRIVGASFKFRQIHEENGGTWGTTNENVAGVVLGTGNNYSELIVDNFLACVGRIPQYADTPNTAWYMNRAFYFSVALLEAIQSGGTTMTEVINGNRTPMYLGYPVRFTQVMPKVEANSQVCALFGDLAMGAMLGDRRQVTIAESDHFKFAQDQLAIRGTQRFDINCHSFGNWSATAALREPGAVVGLTMLNS